MDTGSCGCRLLLTYPFKQKKQRKDACKFREFLLDCGFEMSQFSLYIRIFSNKELAHTYIQRVKNHLPEYGRVSILLITDKQYENIVNYHNRKGRVSKIPEQLALF